MVEIPLTRGLVAIVDDEDADLTKFKWTAMPGHHTHYAVRRVRIPGTTTNGAPKRAWVRLHREVLLRMGAAMNDNVVGDHIDGDGLNNRRSNLRTATAQQNAWNTRKRRTTATSKFMGVSWYSRDSVWVATIKINGKATHIGYFEKEEDAAEAYKRRAMQARVRSVGAA